MKQRSYCGPLLTIAATIGAMAAPPAHSDPPRARPPVCAAPLVVTLERRQTVAGTRGQTDDTGRAPRLWMIGFKKGDTSLHRRTVTFAGVTADGKPVPEAVFKSTERVEIKDVDARGVATLGLTCISMEIMRNGRTEVIVASKFPETARVIGRNGLLIRETGGAEESTEPLSIIESLLANVPVPPEPVRAGDEWRTDLPCRIAPGRRVTMVSRLAGSAKVFGITTVHTLVTVEIPVGAGRVVTVPLRVTGDRYLDIATGRMVRTVLHIRGAEVTIAGTAAKAAVDIIDEIVVTGVKDRAPEGSGSPGQ